MKRSTRLPSIAVAALTLTITSDTLNEWSLQVPVVLVPSVDAFVPPIATSNGVWQQKSFRLLNSVQDGGEDGSVGSYSLESSILTSTSSASNLTLSRDLHTTTTTATTATMATAQFGDVIPLQRKSSSSPAFLVDSSSTKDSSLNDLSSSTRISSSTASLSTSSTDGILNPADIKRRNRGVALVSIALAVMNYIWEYLHPLQPIQILYQMEQQSAPITVIGTTNKPTVVDFWAPWCENCKLLAPTLLQMEEEYGKDINFVMINGDDASAWPLIEAFGVDAIPHLALVEADGTVDTALIGPVPKQWLQQDFQVLIDNAKLLNSDMYQQQEQQDQDQNNGGVGEPGGQDGGSNNNQRLLRPLPYQMLDVFANRPNERRIQVLPQDLPSNPP